MVLTPSRWAPSGRLPGSLEVRHLISRHVRPAAAGSNPAPPPPFAWHRQGARRPSSRGRRRRTRPRAKLRRGVAEGNAIKFHRSGLLLNAGLWPTFLGHRGGRRSVLAGRGMRRLSVRELSRISRSRLVGAREDPGSAAPFAATADPAHESRAGEGRKGPESLWFAFLRFWLLRRRFIGGTNWARVALGVAKPASALGPPSSRRPDIHHIHCRGVVGSRRIAGVS